MLWQMGLLSLSFVHATIFKGAPFQWQKRFFVAPTSIDHLPAALGRTGEEGGGKHRQEDDAAEICACGIQSIRFRVLNWFAVQAGDKHEWHKSDQ